MLMNGGPDARAGALSARHIRVLSNGGHVVCALTGARIPLQELRYWSVRRQKAYVDARASLEADRRAAGSA